ncbi:MAG: cob(I)yrinic acid a,c-diamide adenosyltransferase [Alphaproteobacteria bacterium]|nr:cob(I)yrinic acid a,c-diamide adenosyltransferase [Alphaproteobacteria bacterium]
MKIYTKIGDKGQTALLSGNKVWKFDLQIESYGTVDELNACIGLVIDIDNLSLCRDELTKIQIWLFNLGSILACDLNETPAFKLPEITVENIGFLEQQIDRYQAMMPPLKYFILPQGMPLASQLHHARTVCRRAERRLVEWVITKKLQNFENYIIFLNRLSDYLFVLARYVLFKTNKAEIYWKP